MNAIVEHINSAGFAFTRFALPMLIQSGMLIVILLFLDLLLRKKVKAVFRYWIWMLVLLKLVLPTSLSSPLSLGYLFGDKLTYQDLAETVSVPEPAELAPAETLPAINPLYIQPNPYIQPKVPAKSVVEPAIAELVVRPPVTVTPLSWQGVVFLVWLAVVIAMGLLLLQRALFVRGLVAQAKKAGRLMNEELEHCRTAMKIKRRVGLKVSPNATTPSVCGLIRPVILVPWNLASTLGASRLRTVLMHELAHIRRADLWINLAQTILQIIYFYNPLLWIANCVIRRIREQAVDEAVLVAMGGKARQYPQTLVDVAKMAFKRPALSLRLIGVVESESALAGRIKHILGRPIPKTAKLGIVGVLAVIIAGAILLPMARAQRLALTGRSGPLNIRLAAVRPDGSDVIYDGDGNKLAEKTFADIAARWDEDEQHRTFIFELPKIDEPILFSPFLKIKTTGAKHRFGAGQHPVLYYSDGRLKYCVGLNFPRTYKKLFERQIRKVDLTLNYYYGRRGMADFVFSGPFTPGQKVRAEGDAYCELTPKEDLLNFGNHPAAFFSISSKTRFDGDSVLIYDTSGRCYLLQTAGGRSGRGGTYYNYRAEGLTLNSIACVTVGEKPYEATFKNVVVSYPDRPVLDRMEFLDEMCRRLDLTGLSGEDLDNYKFESPADAIKVIDIVRGRWFVMQVFDAIRYSNPRIELSNLHSQAKQKLRSTAARWAKAGHPDVRAMGIRLGLVGGWPEFMDMALDWLEQDVVVYDMGVRTYRGLEEGAKGKVAGEVASYPIALNSEQAERLKQIILSTDSPRIAAKLFRLFWRADKDMTYEICRDLTQDDRPWIWWHAMRLFFNRCNEKLRPFENLSEKIQKRLILVHQARGGSSRLFDVSSSGKDYETVAKEAYAMLPAMFTARLARMDSSICHNVRQVMAKHLDREIAAKAMTDFLREISTESNQRLWAGDSPYFGTCCSTAYYIARHINSLYDVNIKNLGKYETREDSEAIPLHISQLKKLIAGTLRWCDARNDTGLLIKFTELPEGEAKKVSVGDTTTWSKDYEVEFAPGQDLLVVVEMYQAGQPMRIIGRNIFEGSEKPEKFTVTFDRAYRDAAKSFVTHNIKFQLGDQAFTIPVHIPRYLSTQWWDWYRGEGLPRPETRHSKTKYAGIETLFYYGAANLSMESEYKARFWIPGRDVTPVMNQYAIALRMMPLGSLKYLYAEPIGGYQGLDGKMLSRTLTLEEAARIAGEYKQMIINSVEKQWTAEKQAELETSVEAAPLDHFVGKYAMAGHPDTPAFEITKKDDVFIFSDLGGPKFEMEEAEDGLKFADGGGERFRLRHDASKNRYRLDRLGMRGEVQDATSFPLTELIKIFNEKPEDIYVATLPNGVTVELMGVCELPGQDKQWWAADGSLLENIFWEGSTNRESLVDARQVVFRIRSNESDPAPTISFSPKRRLQPPGSWSGAFFVKKNNQTLKELRGCSFSLHDDQKSIGISADVGYGPWKTLTKLTMNSEISLPKPVFTDIGYITWNEPTQEGGKTTVSATLFDAVKVWRIVAVDKQGDIHASSPALGHGFDGHQIAKATFSLPLSRIEKFRFQTRPFSEITFKNVSLRPGVKTDVQVEVEKNPQNVFTETLPNGVTVELVGVCEHPSEGKQWWRPNGTLWEDRPYEEFSSYHSMSGEKGYELVWRLSSDEDVVYEIESADQGGSAGQAVLHRERGLRPVLKNGEFYGVTLFFSPKLSKTAIKIGVGLDRNWKTIASLEGDVSKAASSINNVHLYPAVGSNGQTYIDAAYRFPEGRRQAYRLVAIDTSNKQHIMRQGSETKDRGNIHCRKQIDLPLKQIKKIHFQTQPLQQVTFENVSLRPGMKTNVWLGFEETVSPKLVMLLGAINSCAAETDLNVESISITARNIEIKGDTSGRTNTRKFLDAIKDNGLQVSRLSLDTKNNRGRFSITAEPKENWRQWWQKHKSAVPVEDVKERIARGPEQVQAIDKMLRDWFGACVAGDIESMKKAYPSPDHPMIEDHLHDMKELLGLNPGWQFSFLAAMWDEADAMAVSGLLNKGDPKVRGPVVLVWTLNNSSGKWAIVDIDLEKFEGAKRENLRFLKEHLGAHLWFDNPEFSLGTLSLADAPHTTKSDGLPDLFEERPKGSKSYELRGDIDVVYNGLDGTVYYIPEKRIFYVQHDKLGSGARTFYGPFDGDPHKILRLQIDVPVEGEGAWGETVNGVQCRLRANREVWKVDEVPTFKIDLKSMQERRLPHGPAQNQFEVQLDGQWYRHVDGIDLRSWIDLSPVTLREGIHLALFSRIWQRKSDGSIINLAPGRHSIRIAFLIEDSEPPVEAISNPVEIEILPADSGSEYETNVSVEDGNPAKEDAVSKLSQLELLSVKPPIVAYDVKLNFADPTVRDGSFHSEQSIAFSLSFHNIEIPPAKKFTLGKLLIGQTTWPVHLEDNGITIKEGVAGQKVLSLKWPAGESKFEKVIKIPVKYGQKEYSCPVHIELDRRDKEAPMGSYWFCAYLSGRLPWGAGGRGFEIVNLDQQMEFRLTGDGSDPRDAVLGIDINGDGRIDPAKKGGEQFDLYEPFIIGSKLYQLAEVDPYLPRVVFREVDALMLRDPLAKTDMPVEGESSETKGAIQVEDRPELVSASIAFHTLSLDGSEVVTPAALTMEIKDRAEVSKLASFFPKMEEKRISGSRPWWNPAATIIFYRSDDTATVVNVSSDMRNWVSDVSQGDWPVQGDLRECLSELKNKAKEPNEKDNLVWGQQVNGLRAAVEFVPEEKAYSFSRKIGRRYHIQNVSAEPVQFISDTWRQDDRATVEDQLGNLQPVGTAWYSGRPRIERYYLEPGKKLVLESSDFGLAANNEQANALEHPVGCTLVCKPGTYYVGFSLRIPNVRTSSLPPQAEDWTGVLQTGKRKLVVTAASGIDKMNDVPVEIERSNESTEPKTTDSKVQEPVKQRGGISGVVVNSDTGDPIIGAYVGVGDFGDSGGSNYSRHREQGFHDKTETDEQGRFELKGLAFTDTNRELEYHPLVVTHPDFVRHDEKIELPSSRPAPDVKVSLRPAAKIEVTIVDADGNPLEGQWLLRLEALDGRRFIPPGSDPHLSSFASSIWEHTPDLRTKMGVSNGFTFTELDSGEYSIEALKFELVDKPTPQNIWKPTITYHGSIPSLKIEAGQSKEVKLAPQDHQTKLTITAPEFPDKLFDKLERSSQMPLMCLISRSPGALLWDDGKIRHLEDQRLGRIDKKRFFRGFFSQGQPLTINNLPPDSYSLFTMAVYGQVAGYLIGARADLAKGDNITIDIPWRQPTGASMFGPNRSFDYPVRLEERDYSLSELCEILTSITQSNPRIIADSSIKSEKLRFGISGMSVWDVLEELYLNKGWKVDEGQNKTLIIKPAKQTGVQSAPDQDESNSPLIVSAVDNKAELASGATVELMGLSYVPVTDHLWWRTDGSLLPKALFDDVSFTPSVDPNWQQFAYYTVAIQIKGKLPREIGLLKWNFTDAVYGGSSSAYADEKRVYYDNIHSGVAKFPKAVKKTTLRLGIVSGGWQTIFVGRHYGFYEKGRDTAHVRTPETVGGPGGVRPYERGLHIEVTYNITDRDFRVVAVDKDGKVHLSSRGGSGGTQNLRRTTASFPELTHDRLREFRFQVRPYEWVEFKDVSLRPGEEALALAGQRRIAKQKELEKWLGQGKERRIREKILILRESRLDHINEPCVEQTEVISAMRELVRIGEPALQELTTELQQARHWLERSLIAFVLRAIGNETSVPVLIEVLAKSKYRGGYGIYVKDDDLARFMLDNQYREPDESDREVHSIIIACPVIEITKALEKITGHSEGPERFSSQAAESVKQR